MTYAMVTSDRFGGLDALNDPQELGASTATDLLNIDLDQRGRIRTRDGLTALTAAAASNQNLAMGYYISGGTEQVIVLEGVNTIKPYNLSSGTAGTTQVAVVPPSSNNAFARFGDPTNTRFYAAGGSLYRYDGAAWTVIGAAPITPTLVAVTANDNRLVISDGDKISFSDAGAPETYGANNFVRLWPGDGETVKALVRWRDFLFAFKQTKFAVFTGTSIDSAGNPVFNYRSVDTGRGAYSTGMAVAGEEGVYFADATGIYVTTGDAPRYISRAIEPWLRAGSFGNLPSFVMTSNLTMNYNERRLYVTYPNNASSTTLIYDPALDAWMVSQFGATTMVTVPPTSAFRGVYIGEFTSKKVAKVDSAATTDLGSAISWHYQSGFYPLPGANDFGESRIRYTDLWGQGTVNVKIATEGARPNDVLDTGSNVTLGTAPAVARGRRSRSVRGRLFQHVLSGSGVAEVSRIDHWVRRG